MKTVYGFIWTLTGSAQEFEERVPALLDWLGRVKKAGKLAACGSWSDGTGGLTVLHADSADEARTIHDENPLQAIGTSVLREWEVFFANLETS